jgi:hypothetical protein
VLIEAGSFISQPRFLSIYLQAAENSAVFFFVELLNFFVELLNAESGRVARRRCRDGRPGVLPAT